MHDKCFLIASMLIVFYEDLDDHVLAQNMKDEHNVHGVCKLNACNCFEMKNMSAMRQQVKCIHQVVYKAINEELIRSRGLFFNEMADVSSII